MENAINPNFEVNIESKSVEGLVMWNNHLWKTLFSLASKKRDSYDLHTLRTSVYSCTVEAVKMGQYQLENGTIVKPDFNKDIAKKTIFYDKEIVAHDVGGNFNTEIKVVNDDCLAFASRLGNEYMDVCVLNMANRRTPGGGVIGGAGAQEEYLFRCSDYFRSLYQYSDLSFMHDIEHAEKKYPLDRNFGGIFSPGVTIIRGREEDGYPFLEKPWKVNMIAVPAMSHPRTLGTGDSERIAPDLIEGVKNKMRTILRIAYMNRQETLVLGAFGCGAFHNPPRHVAELFKEVLAEPEFDGVFRNIFFVIKEDHNSRGEGNFKPFASVFNE